MTATATAQLSFTDARAYLLERARTRGVALEVYGQRSARTSIRAYEGAVDEFKLSNRQGLGLRALVNGAWGYAHTENLSTPALDRALDGAIENAALVAPEPHARLVAWGEPPEMDLYGEGLSGVTVERKVNVALALERSARDADPRVTSVPYNSYSDGESETAVANTEGLDRAYKALNAVMYVAPLVSEDGQNKMKGEFAFTREFEELDPTATALEATRKSLALLGAKPAPTGAYPTVIDRECLATLLAAFSSVFSAKMVQEGKSLLAGKLGETIGSAHVTLVDDATLPRGFGSRPFDDEGHPSAPLTLVDGGTLRSFLHNSETAAKDGVESTGHAERYSYAGRVGVGTSNFFLAPGAAKRDDLLRDVGTGLLLTGVMGVHAGANPITGDFSLQAEGFWIENGEVAHPLEVFTVAGNFLELLGDIQAVGDDLKFSPAGAGAPSVRVSSLSVGGE